MWGILITFEGIDGSGKSTALADLARWISAEEEEERGPFRGREFLFTAEPTDGEEGRLLRERLKGPRTAEGRGPGPMGSEGLEELFLFLADHARHLREVVVPALDRGMVVISDRYSDSRIAYQGTALRGIVPGPMEWVGAIHRPWSVVPDKTILFRINPAQAVERCLSRKGDGPTSRDPEKFEREAFLREVAANFEVLARNEPERFVIIDAGRERSQVLKDAIRALAAAISEEESGADG
ncbi:dTMP kinase [Methanotrichaceae archaeon M04Ac]|uniref:Probable thymidylate kinase n=1 Tax=Candidatus Methanocrinis alkalitolerans TaxID=3033395 RepID=A0ABT5XC83_9EURY|nr:dTMP kinase [Candidatus Methanocrinis alkalitolerans]MCR3882809.1 dTMP kinase [Methanothrix sp.]MDF0592323.1 dTMP kinase [Candidatus Methanocrinis alkalitolerans]